MSAPQRLGKYEITEVLGRGAMGVVYRGFDPGIRRTVAIKTIRRDLIEGDKPAAAMLARFRNEARAAGQLAHPGIVAVHDYGEDAEVAYIAMEYVEGNSLREYFERGTRFGERDVVSIMTQLLDALAHAHQRRVWHRDIKPANLIVMMDGKVKVADFGIARIETSDLTHTGALLGSPGYMAPEQYAAATIDHRADIFAAGVVLYQLLTGRKPFVGSPEQVAYAICHGEVPPPSVVDPGKEWERYDGVIATALAKRPDERFKSAEAFRDAILAAHAAPASPTITPETIISEVIRPVGLNEQTAPPRAQGATPERPPAAKGRSTAAIGLGAAIVALVVATAWLATRRDPAPATAPVVAAAPQPAPAAAPAPAQPARGTPEEVVFWESMRNSTNPAELKAYLEKYPEGTFAPLAKARLDALAAAAAKKPAVKPEPPLAVAAAPAAPKAAAPAPKPEAPAPAPVAPSPAPKAAEPTLRVPASSERPDTLRLPQAAASASAAHRYDGRWTARLACEDFHDLKAFERNIPVEIRDGALSLTGGTAGKPGYWLVAGQVAENDRLTLTGTVIAASQVYRGRESAARFDGRFGANGFEGTGAFGQRKCTLAMTRAQS